MSKTDKQKAHARLSPEKQAEAERRIAWLRSQAKSEDRERFAKKRNNR